MVSLVIIEKGGNVKTVQAKSLDEDSIYKKCNYRKPDNFEKQHTWNVKIGKKKYVVGCYGKTDGKANMENKYDFPPPIDNKLFYGNCALVAFDDDDIVDFTSEEWDKIYDKLFGGFEDLGGAKQDKIDEEMDEDELKNVPKKHLTKEGYLKDGFVVDKDESDEESYDGEDNEDEEEDEEDNGEDDADDTHVDGIEDDDDDDDDDEPQEPIISKKKKNKKIVVETDELSDSDESYVSDNEYVSDLGDELSEDDYEYSDDE